MSLKDLKYQMLYQEALELASGLPGFQPPVPGHRYPLPTIIGSVPADPGDGWVSWSRTPAHFGFPVLRLSSRVYYMPRRFLDEDPYLFEERP